MSRFFLLSCGGGFSRYIYALWVEESFLKEGVYAWGGMENYLKMDIYPRGFTYSGTVWKFCGVRSLAIECICIYVLDFHLLSLHFSLYIYGHPCCDSISTICLLLGGASEIRGGLWKGGNVTGLHRASGHRGARGDVQLQNLRNIMLFARFFSFSQNTYIMF